MILEKCELFSFSFTFLGMYFLFWLCVLFARVCKQQQQQQLLLKQHQTTTTKATIILILIIPHISNSISIKSFGERRYEIKKNHTLTIIENLHFSFKNLIF